MVQVHHLGLSRIIIICTYLIPLQHVNSESSSEDAPLHYTAKIEAASRGPGGIGSYLAKQEFGSNEGQTQTTQDSGYVSHGSGGGYPKMQLPVGSKLVYTDFTKCK